MKFKKANLSVTILVFLVLVVVLTTFLIFNTSPFFDLEVSGTGDSYYGIESEIDFEYFVGKQIKENFSPLYEAYFFNAFYLENPVFYEDLFVFGKVSENSEILFAEYMKKNIFKNFIQTDLKDSGARKEYADFQRLLKEGNFEFRFEDGKLVFSGVLLIQKNSLKYSAPLEYVFDLNLNSYSSVEEIGIAVEKCKKVSYDELETCFEKELVYYDAEISSEGDYFIVGLSSKKKPSKFFLEFVIKKSL